MPDSQKKTRVAFSVTNCLCHDQRVRKIAGTVLELKCDITLIGRIKGNCGNPEIAPFNVKRFRMLFKRGFLFYKFYNLRLFFYLLFHKFDLLVSNDLDTLLPNFLVSKIKRVPLVYDSHEYFTGVPEVQNRKFVKWVWTSFEKMIFPRLKYVMTVCDPIADIYEKKYNVKPLVVRNVSKNADHITPFTRDEIGFDKNDLILIIQGTGINIDRGAEELIDAVNITDGVALLVVGSGDVVPSLKKQVTELNLNSKVTFIETVGWETLIRYTKSADLGICIDKDTNLNYKYILPNKLFDYITAGIPVLASDLQETGRIINETGCGYIIPSVTPANLSNAFSELQNNRAKLAVLRKNAVAASAKLNWEIESRKVIELYSQVLNNL